MLDNWLALPTGVFIAMVSSTVGIGGGILWMPFLLIILKLSPENAVVTSLMIQTAGMGSGSLAYWRQKQVDFRLMGLLLALTIPGIAFGAWLTRMVNATQLELVLGVLTLLTAFIFVSASQIYGDAGRNRVQLKIAGRYGWAVTFMSIASGMLSVSVGEWLVPLMRSKMELRMTTAVATSIATIFGTCILGSSFHLLMGGHANTAALAWAVPGVILGGQIGPRLAERTNDRVLKELFVFLLTLIGIHLIYNSY
ncbi:MAG: sulfite exporter TauE/SafE family protein [Desulfobacteraceae bacterium]|nr:sulfite exporter TauE/SafE family protein [Desulfobacteraceae bacterium]